MTDRLRLLIQVGETEPSSFIQFREWLRRTVQFIPLGRYSRSCWTVMPNLFAILRRMKIQGPIGKLSRRFASSNSPCRLLRLQCPFPSMNGEPLELPMIGFADRGESNHGRSQLVSGWCSFEIAVLT